MKTLQLILLLFLAGNVLLSCHKISTNSNIIKPTLRQTSSSAPVRYRDLVFDSSRIVVTRNIVYRTVNDYAFGDSIKWNLALDFWEPSADTTTKRPLLVFIHGGGFIGGFRDWEDETSRFFARYGYCVANIDYRVDRTAVADTAIDSDQRTIARVYAAIYRANQDARYAIRYCKSRAADGKLDTNFVYVGGGSAGAITSLNVAYLNNEEVTVFSPLQLNQMGLIDYGNLPATARVRAAIIVSGALLDTNWVKPGDAPAALFHSTGDTFLPIDCGLDGPWKLIYACGGRKIAERLTHLGIPNHFEQTNDPFPATDTLTHGTVWLGTENVARGVDSVCKFLYNNNLTPH